MTTSINNFWKHVNKSPEPDGCWMWTGSIRNKYGQITYNKAHYSTHRFSYMLEYGKIPDNMFVCHKCDNPRCVNPKHLFLGTAQDNVNDMIAKGRDRYPKGQDRWNAKLSDKDVYRMREMYSTGRYTQKELMAIFNVSAGCVCGIVNGKTRTTDT